LALYECVFIARQDITSAQVDGLIEQFETAITENGGSIVKRELWGLRSMAYKIKKNRKGHYVLLNIDSPAAAVHEMERQMRINEDVLRYMTLAVDEHEEGPSIVMRNKDRVDERPRSRPRFDRDAAKPDRDASAEKAKVADVASADDKVKAEGAEA